VRATVSLERLLAIALVGMVILRFTAIGMDPPGGIVTYSGAPLTDEGFYLKAARLHQVFGVWRNDCDANWSYHTPLFTLVTVGLSVVTPSLLFATRYFSVLCSTAAIAVFYAICRHRLPRVESLVACVLVAGSFDNFAFSRLAFVEPLGTLLSLAALFFWVIWRGRWPGAIASMLFAVMAVLAKTNFVYTIGAVAALWLWEAMRAVAAVNRVRAAALVLIVGIAAGMLALAHVGIGALAPGDARNMEKTLATEFTTASLQSAVTNEATLVTSYSKQPWRRVLVAAVLLGLIGLASRRRGKPPASATDEGCLRASVAMAVWCLAGVLFFGYFEYQVPRWLYFTAFPLAYFAVDLLRTVVPRRRTETALVLLALLHLASQAPAVCRYANRSDKASLLRAARDIAHRVGNAPNEVVVFGNLAHLASLFGDGIRPLCWGDTRDDGELRERVLRWRPGYFVGYSRELAPVQRACGDLIERVEPVTQYTIMENYYQDEDLALLRIIYRGSPERREAPLSTPR